MIQKSQIDELHEAVKEYSNERTLVMAIPGMIKNSGRMIDAVQVTIGHNPTHKIHKFIYRGLPSNFKDWLKKTIDKLENQ